jgi:DNA-binding NarL/FixJ family response regulator
MTSSIQRYNLILAEARDGVWSRGLEAVLAPLPVELHWSHADGEAIDLAASGRMHLAIVDDALPTAGGLDTLRRFRSLGLGLPCLLVSQSPTDRLLSEAIRLDAFSVISAMSAPETMARLVATMLQRAYDFEGPTTNTFQ